MASHSGTPNVGAIDPKLRTSPVFEETADDSDVIRQQVPDQVGCWFNGEAFASGAFVRSGDVVLECRRGLWVEIGPADPGNI